MKKLLLLTTIFSISLLFTSCGDDDDDTCDQAAWIGTYTLTSDAVCELDESTTLEADETLVILAGDSDSTIEIDGEQITFNEETCTFTFLTVFTLDGDELSYSFSDDCKFTYKKN